MIYCDTSYLVRLYLAETGHEAVRDGDGKPCVFKTEVEAQREITDFVMTRLQEFIDDEDLDFEDAMTVEEYVVPVDVYPDGSIVDVEGNCFR